MPTRITVTQSPTHGKNDAPCDGSNDETSESVEVSSPRSDAASNAAQKPQVLKGTILAEGAVGGDADNNPIVCDRDDNYVNEAEVKEKVEGEDQATTTTSNSPGVAVFEAASTNTSSLNNPSHKNVETVAEDAEKEEEEKKNGLNQEEEKADEANTNNQEIGHRKV